MTRMPRWRLSAAFSAACRHTLQVRERLSASFHSLVWRSMNRGVDAMRNRATACPVGVKRSSGPSARLPTMVITVSPAAMASARLPARFVFGYGSEYGRRPTKNRATNCLMHVGTQDLGTQDALVEVHLPVELLDRRGLRGQV